jgi:hypothetical protein
VGNLKGKPGPRSASAGTQATPSRKEPQRRSVAPPAATAEAPYFLPDNVDEATSVEVRRKGGRAPQLDELSAEDREELEELAKPIFVPKGGPKKETPPARRSAKEAPERTPASQSSPRRPSSDRAPNRHRRFRALVAIPIVAATVLSIALAVWGPDKAPLYRAEIAIAQALGFWGCLAAALIFDEGDYLRRAWLLEMICYALIFAGDLTLTTGVFSHQPWAPLANGILTLTANASAMGGIFLLARTAWVAGIEMPGSSATRRVLHLLALVIALAAAGPTAFITARDVLHGDQRSLMYFASCMGDIFCFAMIAPLLLTAVAMRGGLLAWPWGFMTASGLAWLAYDGIQTLSPLLFRASADAARPVAEIARCIACTCAFSAGLAQRWTILDVSE